MAIKFFDVPSILAAVLPKPVLQTLISDFPELSTDSVEVHNHVFNTGLQSFHDISDNNRQLVTVMILECFPFLLERVVFGSMSEVHSQFQKMLDQYHGQTFPLPTFCCFHTHVQQTVQQGNVKKKPEASAKIHDSGIY
ncbi:hypothetical protein [Yersinia ruckeri]|uniref:hypothetical protein n=1 Tax=Yersinia ruckeri TaxID=29486 RepID=UPI0022377DD2|nr:hypothetical protein [Yersinia ruckeri]MCW6598791.1 hypothetical protein [Yersinia ruckeri]